MIYIFNMVKKMVFRLLVLILTSLLLVACGGGVTGDADNFVVVDDQVVVNLKEITLTKASVKQTVCVVVLNSSIIDGSKGSLVLAEKTLEEGEYNDLKVSLSRESKDNESMYVELRAGACGDEAGGTVTSDVLISQGSVSAVEFMLTRSTEPFVEANDQTMSNVGGNAVMIHKVIANSSFWLVVHRVDETQANNLGDILGYQLVSVGHSSAVRVALMTELTSNTQMTATLYSNTVDVALEDEDFDEFADVLVMGVFSTFVVSPNL